MSNNSIILSLLDVLQINVTNKSCFYNVCKALLNSPSSRCEYKQIYITVQQSQHNKVDLLIAVSDTELDKLLIVKERTLVNIDVDLIKCLFVFATGVTNIDLDLVFMGKLTKSNIGNNYYNWSAYNVVFKRINQYTYDFSNSEVDLFKVVKSDWFIFNMNPTFDGKVYKNMTKGDAIKNYIVNNNLRVDFDNGISLNVIDMNDIKPVKIKYNIE